MAQETKCCCGQCRTRGLMAPVMLITVGVMALIVRYSHRYDWSDLWPLFLIAAGLVSVASALASNEGHRES